MSAPSFVMTSFTFKPDGHVPNSPLPVVVYKNAIDFTTTNLEEAKSAIGKLARRHGWYLDWAEADAVFQKTHYHSTAHEVLIVFDGIAKIKLGGKYGSSQCLQKGDMIFIPAGVGHMRICSHENFTVLGLYPNGQKWDLQWAGKSNYHSSLRRIRKVPFPKVDPIIGKTLPKQENLSLVGYGA